MEANADDDNELNYGLVEEMQYLSENLVLKGCKPWSQLSEREKSAITPDIYKHLTNLSGGEEELGCMMNDLLKDDTKTVLQTSINNANNTAISENLLDEIALPANPKNIRRLPKRVAKQYDSSSSSEWSQSQCNSTLSRSSSPARSLASWAESEFSQQHSSEELQGASNSL